ncbi:hypothetical protein B0H14DRAFT_3883215 [Mycena olivaceomarginata]|nr:hypothetical protein B0H14DRAFT_3883215 [Mycena olivaceomarginata]
MSALHACSGCSVLRVDLFPVHSVSHCACMRFAPPRKLATRTPALDDAHQSVDTLGMFARGGWFVLAASVFSNLFAFAVHKRLTLCMRVAPLLISVSRVAPPVHKFVTRTPALDDAHQSVDTLGMLLRWGRFDLAICSLSRCTGVSRVAPPVHKFVTRTPALDDAHQSVDTLGMLLRWGRFDLAIPVLDLFAFTDPGS